MHAHSPTPPGTSEPSPAAQLHCLAHDQESQLQQVEEQTSLAAGYAQQPK